MLPVLTISYNINQVVILKVTEAVLMEAVLMMKLLVMLASYKML